jgi:hypothetical protein
MNKPNPVRDKKQDLMFYMKETLELLAFYPDLLKELQEERRKIEKGEFITLRDYRAKYKKR